MLSKIKARSVSHLDSRITHLAPRGRTGKHEFSWAVMPHVGSFLESDVPEVAYIFNSPLHRE